MSNKKRTLSDTDGLRKDSKDTKRPKKGGECSICLDNIIDSGAKRQEAIFCEGDCQAWLHRRCAGLTKQAFRFLSNSKTPFYCPHCHIRTQAAEIQNLKEELKKLTSELSQLKSPVSVPPTANPPPHPQALEPTKGPKSASSTKTQSIDRKYNVVVYGIQECPSGTVKSERNKHDVNKVLSVFSKLDNDIQSFSIKDSLRLGKYKANSQHPRPILAKLNRAMDASSILSKRADLPTGITIKPDMSIPEQQTESILLKERWSLIQSGVNKKDIKIKASVLYVHGKKHAEVTNSTLVKSSSSVVTPNDSSSSEAVDTESASADYI